MKLWNYYRRYLAAF